MKLRPSPYKMLLIIMGIGLFFALFTFVIPLIINNKIVMSDIVLTCILIGISVIFSIFTYVRAYYVLERDGILQQLLFKKKFFSYKDISFIDDIKSRQKKTLVMYLSSGRQVLLAMDDRSKMLFEVTARCPNLLSRAEFLKKHPNVRL